MSKHEPKTEKATEATPEIQRRSGPDLATAMTERGVKALESIAESLAALRHTFAPTVRQGTGIAMAYPMCRAGEHRVQPGDEDNCRACASPAIEGGKTAA